MVPLQRLTRTIHFFVFRAYCNYAKVDQFLQKALNTLKEGKESGRVSRCCPTFYTINLFNFASLWKRLSVICMLIEKQ